jgi:hypothetical protein
MRPMLILAAGCAWTSGACANNEMYNRQDEGPSRRQMEQG